MGWLRRSAGTAIICIIRNPSSYPQDRTECLTPRRMAAWLASIDCSGRTNAVHHIHETGSRE